MGFNRGLKGKNWDWAAVRFDKIWNMKLFGLGRRGFRFVEVLGRRDLGKGR